MTITHERIDSAIEALKEKRDGLRSTLLAEEQERAERTAGLVKVAHEWADKNGIGDDLESLMEKLGLPERPDWSVSKIEGGKITFAVVLPAHNGATGHPFATWPAFHYAPSVTTFDVEVGEQAARYRRAGCVCPDAVALITQRLTDDQIDTVRRLGGYISPAMDMKCDSPDCDNGYRNFVQVVDRNEEEECTYIGGVYNRDNSRRLYTYSFPRTFTNDLREVTHGRGASLRGFVWDDPDSGSFGSIIDARDCASFGLNRSLIGKRVHWVSIYDYGAKVVDEHVSSGGVFIGQPYSRSEFPALFNRIETQTGCSVSVDEVREASFNTATQPGYRCFMWQGDGGWSVDSSDMNSYGFDPSLVGWRGSWLRSSATAETTPIILPDDDRLGSDESNQSCERLGHPETEHIHWLGEGDYMTWSRVGFESSRRGMAKANGTFGSGTPEVEDDRMGEDMPHQFCEHGGHPVTEHLHWLRPGEETITHSATDYQQTDSTATRANGTYIFVDDSTEQECTLSDHRLVTGEHVHVYTSRGSTVPAHGNPDGRQRYMNTPGWRVHPGTFVYRAT